METYSLVIAYVMSNSSICCERVIREYCVNFMMGKTLASIHVNRSEVPWMFWEVVVDGMKHTCFGKGLLAMAAGCD